MNMVDYRTNFQSRYKYSYKYRDTSTDGVAIVCESTVT